ncbi:MAG: hypothetical protein ACRELB_18385 [Polyangiaceae bacterium]
MDFREVDYLPVSVLSYAVWREMAGDRPVPEAMAHGADLVTKLDPAEAATLAAFARRGWQLVCQLAAEGGRPDHEDAARARVRSELPFLDDSTFEDLWTKAYRIGMT